MYSSLFVLPLPAQAQGRLPGCNGNKKDLGPKPSSGVLCIEKHHALYILTALKCIDFQSIHYVHLRC